MVGVISGAIISGLFFAIMALGVYLTFRILDFPDLTVDGSFATGGAVAATTITLGMNPYLSTVTALFLGLLVGAFTGVLHTIGKINALLSGILSMIALYSINLRIMGKANVPLLSDETLITQWGGPSQSDLNIFLIVFVIVILAKAILDWFLRTEIGLALRATGNNPRMIRSFSGNTNMAIILGLSLSNGLVAFSGALFAQYQGFADVSMGIGMIIIGLASVIIGEALFGHQTIFRATLAVVGGAVVYRLVIAFAMQLGLEPTDMKLMTALLVIIALVIPRFSSAYQEKKRRKIAENKSLDKGGQANAQD